MPVFVPKLKEEGLLDEIKFTLFVIGSRKMRSEDDYGAGIWNIFAPNLNIYGFDADEEACEIANQKLTNKAINWHERHFPLTLSAQKGEETLYVTEGVDCTSLYPPNETYLQRFSALNNHVKLDFSIEVETTTIDEFCREEKIDDVDFLYLDIQGAELKVLEGAKHLISQAILGIHLEVEFSSLYQQQPLFSDLDPYLKKLGFELFDLMTEHPMCRRPRAISPIYSRHKIGQLLWADALYLRDPYQENAPNFLQKRKQILKLACLADILDYPDYALELLKYLETKYNDQKQGIINETVENCLQSFL